MMLNCKGKHATATYELEHPPEDAPFWMHPLMQAVTVSLADAALIVCVWTARTTAESRAKIVMSRIML